jgi:hypothetical protein
VALAGGEMQRGALVVVLQKQWPDAGRSIYC